MLQAMRREELRALSIKELKIRIKKLQAASDGAKLDDNGKVALATAEMVLDNKMDQLKLMEANLTNSTAGLRNQLYNMNEQELKVSKYSLLYTGVSEWLTVSRMPTVAVSSCRRI